MEWIDTLMHGWGHDTPQEVYWALNDLINLLNNSNKFNLELLLEWDDENYDSDIEDEKVENLKTALNEVFKKFNDIS